MKYIDVIFVNIIFIIIKTKKNFILAWLLLLIWFFIIYYNLNIKNQIFINKKSSI